MGVVLRQAWSESQWTILMGYLSISINVRLYQTYHRWHFFFQEDSVIWDGTVKRLLISYFIGSNNSAKKYQNAFTCVKVITHQRWDVFWDTVGPKWIWWSTTECKPLVYHVLYPILFVIGAHALYMQHRPTAAALSTPFSWTMPPPTALSWTHWLQDLDSHTAACVWVVSQKDWRNQGATGWILIQHLSENAIFVFPRFAR